MVYFEIIAENTEIKFDHWIVIIYDVICHIILHFRVLSNDDNRIFERIYSQWMVPNLTFTSVLTRKRQNESLEMFLSKNF